MVSSPLTLLLVLIPATQWAVVTAPGARPIPAAPAAIALQFDVRDTYHAAMGLPVRKIDRGVVTLQRGTLVQPREWTRLEFDVFGERVSMLAWRVQVYTGDRAGVKLWVLQEHLAHAGY